MGSWRDNEALMDAVDGFKRDVPKIMRGDFVNVPDPGLDPAAYSELSDRIETLNKLVAGHYGVPVETITGRNLRHRFTLPRFVCWYILRASVKGGLSFAGIGKFYDRDHSSIISGVVRLQKEMKDDWRLRNTVTDLMVNWEFAHV